MNDINRGQDEAIETLIDEIVGEYFDYESPPEFESFLQSHPRAAQDPRIAAKCREFFAADQALNAMVQSTFGARKDPTANATIVEPLSLEVAGYEITGVLGQGGMGVVYRGRQLSMDREVALKVIRSDWSGDERQLQRFRTEILSLSTLQAPHIIPVYDVVPSERGPVLVMACIQGRNLREILEERQRARSSDRFLRTAKTVHPWTTLSDSEFDTRLLRVFEQLLQAISATHSHNLLHRDIKPSNLLIDGADRVWLGDFGLARSVAMPDATDSLPILPQQAELTQTGAAIGTLGYIAPEIAMGEEGDCRSDLFACGVTMYEALTGELPFGSRLIAPDESLPVPARLKRNRNLPLIPRGIDRLLNRLIQPYRERRCASADEALAELREVIHRRTPWGKVTSLWAAIALVVAVAMYSARPQATEAPKTPKTHETVGKPKTLYTVTCNVEPPDNVKAVLIPLDILGNPNLRDTIDQFGGTPGKLRFEGVPPGPYLLEAAIDGFGFIQVNRWIPDKDERGEVPVAEVHRQFAWSIYGTDCTLFGIEILKTPETPSEEMAYFDGTPPPIGKSVWATGELNTRGGRIDPFWLDCHEVTWGAAAKVHDPAAFENLADGKGRESEAIRDISVEDAMEYAERIGKRLPFDHELAYAATNGYTTRFPWGDIRPQAELWDFGTQVKTPAYDKTRSIPPVYGLLSNVLEWSGTWDWSIEFPHTSRVLRGGPYKLALNKIPALDEECVGIEKTTGASVSVRFVKNRIDSVRGDRPTLGFRCARSSRPLVVDYRP